MRIPTSILILCFTAACSGDLTLPGGGPEGPGAPEPDRVRIVDGDDQQARTGELLSDPLVIQVVDSGQAPVPGTSIEFELRGRPGRRGARSGSDDHRLVGPRRRQRCGWGRSRGSRRSWPG